MKLPHATTRAPWQDRSGSAISSVTHSVVITIAVYISVVLAIVLAIRMRSNQGRILFYQGDPGQYAYILHRATGLGIVGFLLIHILDILLIGLGRDVYDHTVEFYGRALIIPMEIALVGAVITTA